MASYIQGYDETRFATTVNRNFLCLICFNVLKDPLLCSRNQHCFCRGCITKHLENSQRCPTCADPLTVETLTAPTRMMRDYLNELNIHCEHLDRGCLEIVQLQHLVRHEATCEFQPVVCRNQGCFVTVSRRNLVHHESELCEFRKLKCHSCGEMAKTLADMGERMETKMVAMETKMTKIATNIVTMEASVKTDMAEAKTDIEGKLEKVNNKVQELKSALIEGFDQIKDVLVKMENTKEEISKEVRPGASGDQEKKNIFVAGGYQTDSVEMFNWRQKLWSPLQSMPEKRWGGTSFVYNNHVTIAGGFCSGMIKMNINPYPDPSAHWSDSPAKLPANISGYHSSPLYNNKLIVAGGWNENLKAASDCIDEVQLNPPYTVKNLSNMPEPRLNHGTEIFDNTMLIAGGTTTRDSKDTLKSVVLYDVKKNECKQLAPLPYEVSSMATAKWADNIVVIGGVDKHGNALDTVVLYNVKTEQSHMLPTMRSKRCGCAAVVVENNVVVLGGRTEQGLSLKSVEAFNFESYTWEELPEMSEGRWLHTAAVV